MVVHGTAGRYDGPRSPPSRSPATPGPPATCGSAARGAAGLRDVALHGPTPVADAIATGRAPADEVSGDRKAEAVILGVLAQLHAMAGDFDEARERARRGRRCSTSWDRASPRRRHRSSRRGSRPWPATPMPPRTSSARPRRARGDGRALLPGVDRGAAAHALIETGDVDGAERVAALAREIGDDDDAEVQILWRSAQARVLVVRSRAEEAIPLAEAALEHRIHRRPRAPGRCPGGCWRRSSTGPPTRPTPTRRGRGPWPLRTKREPRREARLLDHRPEATTRLT